MLGQNHVTPAVKDRKRPTTSFIESIDRRAWELMHSSGTPAAA